MSYALHMNTYEEMRTLFQTDRLYAWSHGLYFPPALVEISPTHRCNQRCRYCYADKGGEDGEMLPEDLLVRSFREVAEAGVKSVLIQGTGEPLLHKALPRSVALGTECGLTMGLVTNGVLLDGPLQEKLLPHLLFVRFSVLDCVPARYAYLHGCPESQWHRLTENIQGAAELRARRGLNLALWATVYLYEGNVRDAYDIVRYFRDMGLDYLVVQEASYTEFSPCGKQKYASESIPPEEIAALKERILTLNTNDFRVKMRFPINDETYAVGMNRDCWKEGFCQGTKFYAMVSSDGEVYPCWRYWGKKAYSLGSLQEQSFDAIWKGERRRDVETRVLTTPPQGDECTVCNLTKLNDILERHRRSFDNPWKDFLI